MSPSQHKCGGLDLARQVRLSKTLHNAWKFVEARARASRDNDTQAALSAFRTNSTAELRAIQRGLKKGTFRFEPQRGVLKKRSAGKLPRPIVVAPIVNRIVQRAILDVCQSSEPSVRTSLGQLPAVVDQPTSVGALPNRGVPEAIAMIQGKIADGAIWYVRSDLKDFFTRIPKSKIRAFLDANVTDTAFVDLFMHALETELSNPAEVRELIRLFPFGDVGVPQGSALSALCGNILLHEFDRTLNGRNVTTIRYLDDFVVLAPTKTAVDKTWKQATRLLGELGLEAHDPDSGGGKAAQGQIKDGFDFLSFRITDTQIGPSRTARGEFLDNLRAVIRNATNDIANGGNVARRAEDRFIQSLSLIDRKVRGWGDAFRATTVRVVFDQLDREIDKLVDNYLYWFARHTRSIDAKARRRKLGIALLGDTPRRDDQ